MDRTALNSPTKYCPSASRTAVALR
jgi:hypothetical protein